MDEPASGQADEYDVTADGRIIRADGKTVPWSVGANGAVTDRTDGRGRRQPLTVGANGGFVVDLSAVLADGPGRHRVEQDAALDELAYAAERWLAGHPDAVLEDLSRPALAEARYSDIGAVKALDKYMVRHRITLAAVQQQVRERRGRGAWPTNP